MDSLHDEVDDADDEYFRQVSPRGWHRARQRASYLYVIVIGKDRIKVGVSTDPEQRLAKHRRLAKAYGAEAGRHWISCPGIGSLENETLLVKFCAERAAEQFSREYFAGLDFADVVEYAECLNDGHKPGRRGKVSNPDAAHAKRYPARLRAFESAAGTRVQGTVAEAARWMGLSEARIRKLIEAGELTERQDGHRVPKVLVASMRQWLTE